jgi:threonine/homoserine/homoserine lactone efflux protein
MYYALSVLGLGAVILAAPSLFEIIKWCGVAYLGWLGLKALRSACRAAATLRAPILRARPLVLFRQRFVRQNANPKSVLYFCTLCPCSRATPRGRPCASSCWAWSRPRWSTRSCSAIRWWRREPAAGSGGP